MTDIQARIDATLSMIDKIPYYQNNDLYNKLYVDKAIREVLENSKSIIKDLQAQLSAKDAKIKERDELILIYARDVNQLQHELGGRDAVVRGLRKYVELYKDFLEGL